MAAAAAAADQAQQVELAESVVAVAARASCITWMGPVSKGYGPAWVAAESKQAAAAAAAAAGGKAAASALDCRPATALPAGMVVSLWAAIVALAVPVA